METNKFSDQGEYHDPNLRIEHTKTPPNKDYDPFYSRRQLFFTNVQQQIENEEYYPRDPIAQEDYMQDAVDHMYESNFLSESEAVSIFASWIQKRRPDTTIIQVKGKVAKPFYE